MTAFMRPARWRFVLFATTLAALGVGLRLAHVDAGFLIAFDVAAVVYLVSNLSLFGKAGAAERLRVIAAQEDSGRVGTLVLGAITVAASVAAVSQEAKRASAGGMLAVAFVLGSLALAWLFASLMLALHYAHRYYDPRGTGEGGLDFPGKEPPDFADFCYFSCVLSSTFQVSDVEICDRDIRHIATFHGIAAFFFNIGVVAFAVGLATSAFK